VCGRYNSTAAFDELALRFGITVESGSNEELTARFNVAPSQDVPIITAGAKGRRLAIAKWGFRPSWGKNSKLAPINPRAETVATTMLFSAAVRDGRCLIPATGFYEWKPVPGQKRKQSYFIRLKGDAPFGFSKAAYLSLALWIDLGCSGARNHRYQRCLPS